MGNGFDELDFTDDDFSSDSMDGFGSDNSFGDNGFGNNNGFGDSNGFGSTDGFGGANEDTNGFGDNTQGNDFSGSLNSMDTPVEDNSSILKKYSWVMVVLGVIIVIIVIIVASKISKSKTQAIKNQNNNQQVTTQANNMNANEILGTSQTPAVQNNNSQQSIVINSNTSDGFEWFAINDKPEIDLSNVVDLTFTITSINNRVRMVDTNNNLVIETVLLGSLSGMSGTYELHVPYDKGVKLDVGMNFTVHVPLGTYNGKTVIGTISY